MYFRCYDCDKSTNTLASIMDIGPYLHVMLCTKCTVTRATAL